MAATRQGVRRRNLSRERVVAEGLELIDDVGLDGFTMRGLAARLDVQVGALYAHVTDKEDLLVEVAARLLADVPLPDVEQWDRWLAAFAHAYRAALHRHPRAAQLVSGQLVSNSAGDFPIVEAVLATLVRGGFAGSALTAAYDAYLGWLVGVVGVELAPAPSPSSGWYAARRQELGSVDRSRYPTLAANLPGLRASFALRTRSGADQPMDDAFAAGLRAVLAGLPALRRRAGS